MIRELEGGRARFRVEVGLNSCINRNEVEEKEVGFDVGALHVKGNFKIKISLLCKLQLY